MYIERIQSAQQLVPERIQVAAATSSEFKNHNFYKIIIYLSVVVDDHSAYLS